MTFNKKSTGRASSVPSGLAYGGLVSMLVTLLGSGILAKLVDSGSMPWENIGYGIMVVLLAASFLGAQVTCLCIKRQYILISMLSGLLFFGLLLSITALLFGGKYQAVGVTAVLIFGGCSSAGLLFVRKNRAGKRRKWKVPSR